MSQRTAQTISFQRLPAALIVTVKALVKVLVPVTSGSVSVIEKLYEFGSAPLNVAGGVKVQENVAVPVAGHDSRAPLGRLPRDVATV